MFEVMKKAMKRTKTVKHASHAFREPAPMPSSRLTSAAIVLSLVSMLGIGAQACIGAQHKAIVKSVLDVTQVACVLVDDHTEDEHVLAKGCNIVEEYLPEVRTLMQAKKQVAAHKLALSNDASVEAGTDTSVGDSKGD